MKLNSGDMNDLADLSYINLPNEFLRELKSTGKIKLSKVADIWLADESYWDTGNDDRNDNIKRILKECTEGKFKDLEIIDYENQNKIINGVKNTNDKNTGFVAYTLYNPTNSKAIISIRGSEGEEKSGSMIDWYDNAVILDRATLQQKEALKYVEKYASEEYSHITKIDFTGHSKGGNNVLFAILMASSHLQEKVDLCYLYNAPGVSNSFKRLNYLRIKKMEDRILNYQNKNDIVSSIGNSIGKEYIIDTDYSMKREYLFSDFSFDDHQNYTYLRDKNGLVLSETKTKSKWATFINFITKDLNIEDTLLYYLISKILYIISKCEGGLIDDNIIKEIYMNGYKDSAAIISLINSIANPTYIFIKEIIKYCINETVDFAKGILELISDAVSDIIDKGKEVVSDIIDTGKEVASDIVEIGESIHSSAVELIDNVKVKIKKGYNNFEESTDKLIYNITFTNFKVNLNDIGNVLSTYMIELDNLKRNKKRLESIVTNLMDNGWKGNSKQNFYSIRYRMCIKQIDDTINELEKSIEFLRYSLSTFDDLKKDEDRIAIALS